MGSGAQGSGKLEILWGKELGAWMKLFEMRKGDGLGRNLEKNFRRGTVGDAKSQEGWRYLSIICLAPFCKAG